MFDEEIVAYVMFAIVVAAIFGAMYVVGFAVKLIIEAMLGKVLAWNVLEIVIVGAGILIPCAAIGGIRYES